MKLTFKKFKHCKFASEETECFEAIVCIDGVPAIEASNSGHGGNTYLCDIVEGSLNRLEAYAASLPLVKSEYVDPFSHTAELVIDLMVEDFLARKELVKILRKKTVIKASDGKIYSYSRPFAPEMKAPILLKNPGAIFLNELPTEEALKLWVSK